MKLIATADFSQGPNNPLGLANNSRHVKRGTVFSIGGDLPFEKLSKEQGQLYTSISHWTCLFDSDEGRQILAEIERTKESEKQKIKSNKAANKTGDKWYVKIIIGVSIAVIVIFIGAMLHHFFPLWFRS
jgi:hypothetical protein